MKKKSKARNSRKLNDYDDKALRFLSLLRNGKKWRELYREKEGLIAIMLGLIASAWYATHGSGTYLDISSFLLMATATLTGMLGFIISGLAISTGTITNKLAKSIDDSGQTHNLIGILFSFWFLGAVISVTAICFTITYFISKAGILSEVWQRTGVVFLLSYLFVFCILYATSLLGTCIKLFVLGFQYTEKKQQDAKEQGGEQEK